LRKMVLQSSNAGAEDRPAARTKEGTPGDDDIDINDSASAADVYVCESPIQSPGKPRQIEEYGEYAVDSASGDTGDCAIERECCLLAVDESFAQLQAILAGLPMHAVVNPGFRQCQAGDVLTACTGSRPTPHRLEETEPARCKARVEAALRKAGKDYPSQQEALERLEVAYASLDVCMFVNHDEEQMFTAARGTDRSLNPLTFPRDWNSNFSIFIGSTPQRYSEVVSDYIAVRREHLEYTSYGTGHSLGGATIFNLAKHVEDQADMKFARIDIFNMACSPLVSLPEMGKGLEVNLHRTDRDLVSKALHSSELPYNLRVYPVKQHARDAHALTSFKPDPVPCQPLEALPATPASDVTAIDTVDASQGQPDPASRGESVIELVREAYKFAKTFASAANCTGSRRGANTVFYPPS